MPINPLGRGRHAPANLTVFCDRRSRLISNSHEPHSWQGFEVESVVNDDGSIEQAVLLGRRRDDNRRGSKSRIIQLSSDPDHRPKIVGAEGRIFHGGIQETETGLTLVREPRDGFVTRLFRTGLLRGKEPRMVRGNRARDLQLLQSQGIKIMPHGIYPLELGSAMIGAEGESDETMRITGAAEVFDLTDSRMRMFSGTDIPEAREMCADIPKGGAVLCGDLGFLTIHSRGADGLVKIYDVTDDRKIWDIFFTYVEADLKRLREAKEPKKGRPSAVVQSAGGPVIPSGHPDSR